MKFSVLMSVYYKENPLYLNASLISIWDDQSIKPDQIVLVEDGPLTNELYDILDAWIFKLPDIIIRVRLTENVGLGNALNEGLKACKYDLVLRMDSDDISCPNRFFKQVNFMNNNPHIVICGSYINEFDTSPTKIINIKKVPIEESDIRIYAKKRSPFNHPSVAYKKSIVEQVGGYQHHLFMEDYNLWIRILSLNLPMANLPEVLLNMRAGDSMISRRSGINYIKSEWRLANLKVKYNIQSLFVSYIFFIIRSIPRLLPVCLVKTIYKHLRK